MRVVCEKCAAAYAVEDRLIGPRGAKAQCPRCRHVQHVAAPQAEAPAAPAPSAPAAANPRCASCGAELSDAFDQALGTCDACRQGASKPSSSGNFAYLLDEVASAPEPAQGPDLPSVSVDPALAETEVLPDYAEVETAAAKVAPPQAAAPAPVAPADPHDEYLARAAPLKLVESRPARWPLAFAAFAGLLFAVGIAWGIVRFKGGQKSAGEAVPHPVQAAVARWRMLFLDAGGTSAEHVLAGRRKLALDDPFAYAEAEEEFQQALLLDPASDDAISGWVEAVALGRESGLDDESFQEAQELIQVAEERTGRAAGALIAHADLQLARHTPDAEAARALAEEALARAGEAQMAEAHVALGRAYLATSSALAIEHFSEALSGPHASRRAYSYRALAHEGTGDYRQALQDLKLRLDLDPGHLETLGALARIYQEGGDTANALAAYAAARQKHPDNLPIAIRHLAFTYQVDASAREAAVALRALLKDTSSQDRRAVAEGYVHLAVVERLLGNAAQAQAAARKAEELRPGPDVALQRFLLALDAADLPVARGELAKLQGRMGDPGLESILEGRLRIAEGAFGEAYEVCRRGAEADPRRVDALLCAASAAARAGKQDEAVRAAFQAANADPTRVAPRPVMTRFYIRDGETLAGLEGFLPNLAAGESDVSPRVAEGVLLFHQGNLEAADKMLHRALQADEGNALALAYRSLIALARGERAAAVQSGRAAAQAGRRIAVARYAYGAALAADGTADDAEKELRAALEQAPGFSAAEVKLAQLEAKRGDEAAARARLVRVVVRDPTYIAAKRALYKLDSGGKGP